MGPNIGKVIAFVSGVMPVPILFPHHYLNLELFTSFIVVYGHMCATIV